MAGTAPLRIVGEVAAVCRLAQESSMKRRALLAAATASCSASVRRSSTWDR